MNPITLTFKRLDPNAILPRYQTEGAACFDIHALDASDILPMLATTIRTGLAAQIPPGYVMLVYSRSGHGFKNGIRLVNSVGVIDSDYRGEIAVGIRNDSNRRFSISRGDRIAQAMILPIPAVSIIEADSLSDTERGSGGFGSTGR